MMEDIKLLIFDWDGTLMDSVMHIVESMRKTITDLGLEPRQDDEMRNVIGLGMHEAIHMLYPQQMNTEFANHFTSAYRRYFFIEDAPQKLFAGVPETLSHLDRQGYQLAIATGKSRRGLDMVLQDTGIGHLFAQSRCADETRSKPDPLMIDEILQTLEIDRNEALMIGDTEYDMQMAKNAGIAGLGVSYGVHDRQRLHKHGAGIVIDDIAELPGLLDQAMLRPKLSEGNVNE